MRALFSLARKEQPSVIFFDEIDAMMSARKVRCIIDTCNYLAVLLSIVWSLFLLALPSSLPVTTLLTTCTAAASLHTRNQTRTHAFARVDIS